MNPNSSIEQVLALKRRAKGIHQEDLKKYLKEQEPLWTIKSDQTVYEAMCKMLDARVGALIVTKERRVCGIVTERDVSATMYSCGNLLA